MPPLRHRFSGMLCHHEHEHGPIGLSGCGHPGKSIAPGQNASFVKGCCLLLSQQGLGPPLGGPPPAFPQHRPERAASGGANAKELVLLYPCIVTFTSNERPRLAWDLGGWFGI